MRGLSYLALCTTALAGLALQACSSETGSSVGPVSSLDAARQCQSDTHLAYLQPLAMQEGEDEAAYFARVQEAAGQYSENLGADFAASFDAPERTDGQSDADYNAALSEAFLAANAEADCIYTTPSGLQIRVDENGPEDAPSPNEDDLVTVYYQGVTLDGEIFDSAYLREATETFPSNRVIEGWVEALGDMRKGDKWTLYVPPHLAYGENGAGDVIAPNEALIFNVEMVDVAAPPPPPPPPAKIDLSPIVEEARTCGASEAETLEFTSIPREEGQTISDYNLANGEAYMAAVGSLACVFELPSGLRFRILNAVTEGDERPAVGEVIAAHYEGRLVDGTVFDSSYEAGQPIVYPSNGFIPGWNEALSHMRVGETWEIYVPTTLAYGNSQRGEFITPNSTLVFKMELVGLPRRQPVEEPQAEVETENLEEPAGEGEH
ncbi:FKBP-type peptidyl-prolyl cis-trans isomerase [Woodsholea maritima]|uniref:FKBP-type peptidyl-prolyl cis-trans isomerase n=1 Tax=Woodsholea maritima TaxID=240237 RepID=UPI00035FE1CC|nr:FKBP-type peptidyl-prolyl cis-trans isomerase [Woodsholea maritima]